METIKLQTCWLLIWYVLVISATINQSIQLAIYIDCNHGNNMVNCGLTQNSSCKTLQYVITMRVKKLNTTCIEVNIAPGYCDEKDILRLDADKTKVSSWSFIGSNQTSTIVQFSMESSNTMINVSQLIWRKSSGPISFNIHMSEVAFYHCTFDAVNLQFTGLNTNLLMQTTSVTSCGSLKSNIPLFFLQILDTYDTSIYLQNSTFSHNTGSIMYATQFQDISIVDTLFYNNTKTDLSNSSLVSLSASSVILKKSIFNQTFGSSIEVKNVKNFTSTNVTFLSNIGSCLYVKRYSNISLVDTIFKQNKNPVIFIKEREEVNVFLKRCNFSCIKRKTETILPFLKKPDGVNITTMNCGVPKDSQVLCKKGEFVKCNLYCEKCKAGTFSNSPISPHSCESCPAGSYASESGRTNCTLCAAGTFAKKRGATACEKCNNDLFTSDSGAGSCWKMTMELILIVSATIPLIAIPLLLLLGRFVQERRTKKVKAQLLRNIPNYDNCPSEEKIYHNVSSLSEELINT